MFRHVSAPAANPVSVSGSNLTWVIIVAVVALLALGVAGVLVREVLAAGQGTQRMQEIARAVQEGAAAYQRRQFRTLGVFVIIIFFVLLVLPADGSGVRWGRSIFFLVGALFSAVTGFVGMTLTTRGNVRVAAAAREGGERRAFRIAFRTGGVAGMFTVGLGLFGAALVVLIYKSNAPSVLEGFGFGAALLALFMRVGGGIYTKAADVGADLVGKVEEGIPEDDPRNLAVIADLVGDNVGDCAGRGADLFESTAAENIGAMIIGSGLALANPGVFSPEQVVGLMLFPLVARAFGLVASIIGVLVVKAREDEDPMHALNRGYMWTAVLAALGFAGGPYWLLNPAGHPAAWWHFALCGVIGIATSIAFVYITQYYTEYRYRPVKSIAAASVTGPATNIIAGFAVALECTALPPFTTPARLIASYKLGASSGLTHAGLFGTAVATMGMLGTAAYILAMDTFGPITDNAGGIIEMSHQPEEIRKRTDRLDAVGNTTKALTKGYAIGSAALAAFLLFSAYLDEVAALGSPLHGVDISKPEVFVGGLLGAMLVFWFSALAIGAVTKAAVSVIKEVRRQFQADPGILKGTSRPDYGTAVDIVTIGALKAMVAPGLLAVAMPIAVGLFFKLFHLGAATVAAFLMG